MRKAIKVWSKSSLDAGIRYQEDYIISGQCMHIALPNDLDTS